MNSQNRQLKHAMVSPDDRYSSAADVLRDTELSIQDKIKVLENWKDELIQHLESENENMQDELQLGEESETLKAVDQGLVDLKGFIE